MRSELFCLVEQVAISDEFACSESISEVCREVDHFRVELTDPLHFIISIGSVLQNDLSCLCNHVSVDSFALELRHNPENQPHEFFTRLCFFYPQKFKLVKNGFKFSIEMFEPLI